MDPLSARLLLWIGVGVISVAAAVLIIVAEIRDGVRLYGQARAASAKQRGPAEPPCMDCEDQGVAPALTSTRQPTSYEPSERVASGIALQR